MNADYTWSMIIMQPALGLLSNVGGLLTNLKLLMIVDRNKMIRKESYTIHGWDMSPLPFCFILT